MTTEDLKKEAIFQTLTEKQRVFVIEYCSNGADKEKAAAVAYPNSNGKASRIASASANLKVKKIAYLVNKFFGYDPNNQVMSKEEFLGLLAGKLRDPKCSPAFFTSLASMYLRLVGWARNNQPPEPPQQVQEPEPEPDVDVLVRQIESQQRK